MTGPLLLLDVEGWVWRAAWRVRDVGEAERRLTDRIAAAVAAHRARGVLLALSTRPSFRRALWPRYKTHRSPPPAPVAGVLAQLRGREDAVFAPGLEADDVIGVLATGGALFERRPEPPLVILSDDKDLRTIPALHGDVRGRRWRRDRAAADHCHLLQTLTGDAADGYPGCPGVGPRRGARILSEAEPGGDALWQAVVAAFGAAPRHRDSPPEPAAARALRQARLARILRAGEVDPRTGAPRLWRPGARPQGV